MKLFFAVLFVTIVAATEELCTVPGIGTGVCVSTATCASRSGTSTSGYCSGGSDIKCCTGMFCGSSGVCLETSECDGAIATGLCPGPTGYSCCSGIPCDSGKGTCKPATQCTGTAVAGFCPGGSNYKCCEGGSTPGGSCTFESSRFPNSATIAAFFRSQGITDTKALSVILGNLQQESSLNPLACEAFGGPASSLYNCPIKLSGSYYLTGVGLLQWSDPGNLPGRRTQLFNYCKTNRVNPDSVATQLAFLAQEDEWQKVLSCFQEAGKEMGSTWDNAGATAGTYWKCAARWTGWGTAGNRASYATQWYNSCQ